MSWPEDAAARLGIPRSEEFTTDVMVYPVPTKWTRCGACRSVIWNLGKSPNAAAEAAEVHSAFCKGAA